MVPCACTGAMVMVSVGPSATVPVLEARPRTDTVIGLSTTFADSACQIAAGMVQTVAVV